MAGRNSGKTTSSVEGFFYQEPVVALVWITENKHDCVRNRRQRAVVQPLLDNLSLFSPFGELDNL